MLDLIGDDANNGASYFDGGHMRFFVAIVFVFVASMTQAQQAPPGLSWIQVRAVPTERQALQAAEALSEVFTNVVGFQVGGGWRGLALGPFDRPTAERELRVLLQSGLVPSDSFIANGTSYRDQYWPQNGTLPVPNILFVPVAERETQAPDTPVAAVPEQDTTDITEDTADQQIDPESLADARRSEQRLTRDQKRELQRAMAWAGVYTSTIDGLYGPGTRRAMRAWQSDKGLDTTGVLTTRQRARLLAEYNAVFDGLGLTEITNADAGMTIQIPTAVTSDPELDAPFVRYSAKDGSGISLILISQTGDRQRMGALYDVLQTLEIVPQDGPRSINRRGFSIEGSDGTRHTSAFARLSNGAIKGAILIWPPADDARRSRVTKRIFDSFKPTSGALPDAYFLDVGDTPPDLVAGLEIRKPRFTLTGTYLDNRGHVLTADTGLETCARIDAFDDTELKVTKTQDGVTLLKSVVRSAPLAVPAFQTAPVQIPMKIVVGGFSYGGLLGAPTITLGVLEDTKDMNGDENTLRLTADTLDGDIGGPVMDRGGAVLGVLLPQPSTGGRTLPGDTQFVRPWAAVSSMLRDAGVQLDTTNLTADMHPEDLTAIVADFTTVVRCWD